MEISGLSGYFDGYQWIDGPITVETSHGKIESIRQESRSGADIFCKDSFLAPPFVDGHTHLIFGGDRSFELGLKLAGASYAEILEKGGGILSTVTATRQASDEELMEQLLARMDIMLANGTMTAEAKSGYGLKIDEELRLLRLLREANDQHPVDLSISYCGAHAIPHDKPREEYVEDVIASIPDIATKQMAASTDVFCDRGAYTVEETKRILSASVEAGIPVRVHAEELEYTGIGKIAATEYQALSVDHLLLAQREDFMAFTKAGTTAMFMPAATIGLFTKQYPTGWQGLDLNIGLGSDFNPNNMVASMQTAIRLAVFLYRMQPIDAFRAAISGSYRGIFGQNFPKLMEGSPASFNIIAQPSIDRFVTRFDQNLVLHTLKNGEVLQV